MGRLYGSLLSQETLTTSVKDVSIVTNEDIVNHERTFPPWRGTASPWYRGMCIYSARACIIHISAASLPRRRHFESPLLRFASQPRRHVTPHPFSILDFGNSIAIGERKTHGRVFKVARVARTIGLSEKQKFPAKSGTRARLQSPSLGN